MNFLWLWIYSSMYTTGRCQHNQAYGNFYRTVYGQNIYGQNIKNSLVLQLAKHMLFRVPSSCAAATRFRNWSKEMINFDLNRDLCKLTPSLSLPEHELYPFTLPLACLV